MIPIMKILKRKKNKNKEAEVEAEVGAEVFVVEDGAEGAEDFEVVDLEGEDLEEGEEVVEEDKEIQTNLILM